ncbi:unnamed protein product [Candida parapsilosis]
MAQTPKIPNPNTNNKSKLVTNA